MEWTDMSDTKKLKKTKAVGKKTGKNEKTLSYKKLPKIFMQISGNPHWCPYFQTVAANVKKLDIIILLC